MEQKSIIFRVDNRDREIRSLRDAYYVQSAEKIASKK